MAAKKRSKKSEVDIEAIRREVYAQGQRDALARVEADKRAFSRDTWEKVERERNYERARKELENDPFEQDRLQREKEDRFGW
jgi:hypothetical protein